ncbi:hypothetical protein [Streptomyces pacificus]|uniref:Uncharacterized protein n=1 Tax=Streptomyces pacificus TaxID=2705029 RepID=A0A6A0APT9_9ACTN|nr:hypothetical protein [Streptomyces pacificus]GFH34313.1 hypothetical protein SCWH03_05270 [Streptomyces pacificus]
MKPLFWSLAALAVLLLFPTIGTDLITPALNWAASQPILIGFGLGLAAMPHLRKTRPVKTA